ncbi:MAG: ribosome biogenesis GTP-binding protein YihA/YsxC [Anaerofustis sp.]
MKAQSAEYVMSEVALSRFPCDGLFEVVLVGKSNVGKSSFINAMTGRTNLARTSSQPGKTRTANFYLINHMFYFVDMPGYGYAKASKSIKQQFEEILRDYLTKRKTDFVVFFLLDHRHPPTDSDRNMIAQIRKIGIDPVFILTKTDKVKSSERIKTDRAIFNALELTEDDAVFAFSTEHRESIDEVWGFLSDLLENG